MLTASSKSEQNANAAKKAGKALALSLFLGSAVCIHSSFFYQGWILRQAGQSVYVPFAAVLIRLEIEYYQGCLKRNGTLRQITFHSNLENEIFHLKNVQMQTKIDTFLPQNWSIFYVWHCSLCWTYDHV